MSRQSFQGRAIHWEQTPWLANSPKSFLVLWVPGTLHHPHQKPHDALSFQQWIKRKLTMSPCERQGENTWQLHFMSWSHLTEGVLMLSLHSCLKIKEGLDGKQPGIAFQNQLPGNFLHKAPFKMIHANSTSKLKMLHRDRAVLHPFCTTLSVFKYILGLYGCLFL